MVYSLVFAIITCVCFCSHSTSFAACTQISSGVFLTANNSQSDFLDCVSDASDGDTIYISAGDGNATWSSQIALTKALVIIGPGSSSLTITSGFTGNGNRSSSGDYLFSYIPSSPENNSPFGITNLSFDLNGTCGFLYIGIPEGTDNKNSKIRVGDNVILNIGSIVDEKNCFYFVGQVYGVLYKNVFSGDNIYSFVSPYGNDEWSWLNTEFEYSTSDALYVEDNIFTQSTNDFITDNGKGGRLVFRYNTINQNYTSSVTLHDQHGNQNAESSCQVNGTLGSEFYGNKYIFGTNTASKILGQRGGKSLVFNNWTVNTNASVSVSTPYEAYADGRYCVATTGKGQPQHVTDTYIFQNYKGSSGEILNSQVLETGDCCDGAGGVDIDEECCYNTGGTEGIKEGIDWFVGSAVFDGTSGIGCGTLASRPETCTTGVGYWATDQSCSDLTGMVGANPTTPISGTLYKCTSTDTWEAYYTPYTYPHPLRGIPTASTSHASGSFNLR